MARCPLGPSSPLLRTTESASDAHMLRDSRWVWDDPMRTSSCILLLRHRLLFVENYMQDRWIFSLPQRVTETWSLKSAPAKWLALQLGCVVPFGLSCLSLPPVFASCVLSLWPGREWTWELGCLMLCFSKQQHSKPLWGRHPLQRGKCCLGGKG